MSWSGFLRGLNTSLNYAKWRAQAGRQSWVRVIPPGPCVPLPWPRGNQGFKSGMDMRWVLGKLELQGPELGNSCIEGYYASDGYQEFRWIISSANNIKYFPWVRHSGKALKSPGIFQELSTWQALRGTLYLWTYFFPPVPSASHGPCPLWDIPLT